MPHPPFIVLDENSDLPLYQQVYETIRRSILSGEFQAEKRLPATRFLAKQIGVSRLTVVNAYDQLLAEGYLESKIGAGTFVAEHLPEEFLNAPKRAKQTGDARVPVRHLKFSDYGANVLKESHFVLRVNQATAPVAFQHGLAAIDRFPFDVWNKLVNKAYRTLARERFGYGEPAGFAPLRAAIAAHLKSARGVNCAPEQVIVTSGAQHAFDLIGRIFLNPGAEVLIENPCYFGVKQSFRAFGAKFVPIPVDCSGFDVTAARRQNSGARLVYVTPSHQFPLGATLSLARRLQLLEWARDAEGWIIEDDYDSEFRYTGRPLPSLQGLDRDGRVLYIGTFSKTIFPALRLGCIVVPPDLVEIFTAARCIGGSQAPLVDQAALHEFINEGHFGRHIRRMRGIYEERQAVLVAELKKRLAGFLEVEESVAGMHVVGWLPAGVSDKLLVEKAAQANIKTASLSAHSLIELPRGGLILGYTAIDERQIKTGVEQLARLIEDERAQSSELT